MKDKYTKTLWIDGKTKLDAAKLNNIESGVENLFENALTVSEIYGEDGIKVDIIHDKYLLIHTAEGYYMTAEEVTNAIAQAQLTGPDGSVIVDLSGKADKNHTHTIDNIVGLREALDAAGITQEQLEQYINSKGYATTNYVINAIAQAKLDGSDIDLSGKADVGDSYLKAESDARYQPKGNYLTEHQSLANYLTITQSDAKYQPKGNYLTEHQSLANYYTQSQADNRFQPIGNYLSQSALSNYLSKSESDVRYQPKGDYITQSTLGSYLTETESDARYQPKGNYLTEHQSLANYYTKTQSDSRYQPKGNYLVDSDLTGYQTISSMPVSTETGSAQGPDFYLVDESGNALAAFEGGHIRTERFNSAEVYSKAQCDARYAPISSSGGLDVSDLVTNLKTINGNSIVGSGDLSITATPPDMSNYLTRTQIEGSFLRAIDVATINGRSIVNGGNLEITGSGSIDTSGTSTGIYPTYQIHCYNPVASPQVALKKYITDFNFELGKSYRMDVDFGTGNPYTGLTITLSHSDGSEGTQQVFGNFGQSIHQIFTADDNYDKMYIYYGAACDCNFTLSFEDTIQNLVNGPIASDALVNKNNVANVNEVLSLKRKFKTPYKFACMGDSITSDQVSGIGTLVSSYLGCQLIGNFACGSATLTNSADFVYSVAVANNTGTPYNTLTNQVVRLLQRTTPLGEQITWTHQETNESYSIPTNVATGLGFTEDIPDIIYIAIGINDSSANIGDDLSTVITQSYSELTKRTFASALRWAIETLRCVYPKVQIFVATPLFTGLANSVENFSKATVLLKRKAILESCIANGVYCIDSTMKAGYTNQISNINSQGIHPRSYNKCMIAKFIQKEIYNNYIPEIPAEEIIY